MRRWRAFWTPLRTLDAILVFVVIYVTIWSLHPQLLVSSSLLTGGDTGSHLALPAYLKTTGNLFNFTPWYPGWFAGMPAYTYYFVLPDVLATFASYLIGFAVAFKLATILGSVLLPVTAYAMARLFRAPRPIPVALAFATLPFLFDASFTIDGGNLFSSMAGEYAFALSLALALLTIGLFARGVRTNRGYWWAALALSATLASHVLPWLFCLGAVGVLVVFELLHRRGIGGPRASKDSRSSGRANPWAAGLGLILIAIVPYFFANALPWNSSSVLSATSGTYSLAVTGALAALCAARLTYAALTRRVHWLMVLALGATIISRVVAVRYGLAMLFALVALELFQGRPPRDARTLRAQGDFARPVRFALGAGLLSMGLSAWWLFPFATTQNLSDSLGYTNVPVNNLHAIFATLGWFNVATGVAGGAGDRWVIVLGALAIVVAFVVRDRLGMVLASLTVLSFWAFIIDPQSAIWNQRLLPFWYVTIHLVAGWLVGYVAWRWVSRVPRRLAPFYPYHEGDNIHHVEEGTEVDEVSSSEHERVEVIENEESTPVAVARTAPGSSWHVGRVVRATSCVALLGLLSTVPGLITPLANKLHLATGGNQVSAWAQYNYSGYQAKSGWPEYHDLMTTMSEVGRRYGCGRAMWEYSFTQENQFGTPEALMLLPYWTDNCIDSMEGLLMESSPTTPYHYLDQSELSVAPSDPQVGLDYGPLNVAKGVRHLQMLGVKYFMAFSPAVIAEANVDPQLRLVASTRDFPAPGARWRIYLIKNSPMVQALSHTPNVVANISSQSQWLAANQTWWLSPDLQSIYGASSGPASWPRASSITTMNKSAVLPKVSVTHVRVGLQSLSFHVSRLGVPMLVKISYYPRWHVSGATGPYRVSPNLMVVVPTSHDVTLVYASTPALTLGNVLSDLTTLAAFTTLFVVYKRRRKQRR